MTYHPDGFRVGIRFTDGLITGGSGCTEEVFFHWYKITDIMGTKNGKNCLLLHKMKIHYFLRLAFFWLLMFCLFRLCFIAYHFTEFPDKGIVSMLLMLVKGYRLDLSCLAYF